LLVVLLGPTASGKTDLSLRLARHYDIEVVSADARQVYRGLDVGTGKVTAEERGEIPHHLLDVVDVEETYNAGQFARDAEAVLADIFQRKPLALLVGGTFFYVQALLRGLPTLPPTDDTVRTELNGRFEQVGLEPLLAELEAADPAAFADIDRQNPRRVLRALEVVKLTGKPFSSFRPHAEHAKELPFRVLKLQTSLSPEVQKKRIAQRVEKMLATGWVEEVETLLAAGKGAALQRVDAIGYREVVAHLNGELSLAQAQKRITELTNQYARRQRTWLRSEPDTEVVDFDDLTSIIARIDALLPLDGLV
jgi:tRNA dimethylallyltransferase